MFGLLITLLVLVITPIAVAIGWPHRHRLIYRLRWRLSLRMFWDEVDEALGRTPGNRSSEAEGDR